MRTANRTRRLPLIAYALGAGIFLVGTSEFMIAGLLPQMADDLGTSTSHAGLLITAFAVGMLLGAPAMAVLTLRLPRRTTLVAALLVFAAGHVVSALSNSYGVQLVARFVSAVATGTFWAVAAVVITATVPAAQRARALSVLIGGLTVANIAGVPLGTFVGDGLGWRVTFWLLGGTAVVAAALLAPLIPAERDAPSAEREGGVRAELAAFRSRRLWLTLVTIAALQTGVFAMFSYLSPLLTDAAGLPRGAVPAVLVLFGLGALTGSTLGGRLGDRYQHRMLYSGTTAVTITLALVAAFGHVAAVAIALMAVLGVAAFATAVPLTARVIGLAGDAPTLASASGTSAFNVGNAIGPWLGGIALSHGGATTPAAVGAVTGALAVGLAVLALRGPREPDRPHEAAPQPAHCVPGTDSTLTS